jgi:hypothetical protein
MELGEEYGISKKEVEDLWYGDSPVTKITKKIPTSPLEKLIDDFENYFNGFTNWDEDIEEKDVRKWLKKNNLPISSVNEIYNYLTDLWMPDISNWGVELNPTLKGGIFCITCSE